MAVLSEDYFSVAPEAIQDIASVLTLLGGVPVHAEREFRDLAPPLPPVLPDWSPVRTHGGYQTRNAALRRQAGMAKMAGSRHAHCHRHGHAHALPPHNTFWGAFGCSCWAF
jgi:hypothetical protein